MAGSMIYKPADPRLLMQDKVWVDKHNKIHLLDKMNPHHRASLLPFLERRMEKLWMWWMLNHDDENPNFLGQADVERWFNNTPLVRKLREYEEQRNAVDRLATKVRNKTWPIRKRLGAK